MTKKSKQIDDIWVPLPLLWTNIKKRDTKRERER